MTRFVAKASSITTEFLKSGGREANCWNTERRLEMGHVLRETGNREREKPIAQAAMPYEAARCVLTPRRSVTLRSALSGLSA